MKTNKKTMLIAAFVVAVVALAGVGYAAVTDYQATTTNTGNQLESTYLTITQTDGATYSTPLFDKIYYDTENYTDDSTFKYTPIGTHTYTGASGSTPATYAVTSARAGPALVTKDLSLTVNRVGTDETSVELSVTITNCVKVGDMVYQMVFGEKDTQSKTITVLAEAPLVFDTNANTASVSISGVDLFVNADTANNVEREDSKTIQAFLFISGPVLSTATNFAAIGTAGFNVGTEDSDFTFKAKVTVS